MIIDNYFSFPYECFVVDQKTFEMIPYWMCISGTNETTKFLLGNTPEMEFLASLFGVEVETSDYYRISRE